MAVLKEGNSSYGYCWIEGNGVTFYVHVGSSTYGPFSSFADAEREFRRWCA